MAAARIVCLVACFRILFAVDSPAQIDLSAVTALGYTALTAGASRDTASEGETTP